MSDFSFMQIFGAVAGAVPSRHALVWRSRSMSFAELSTRVNGLASFLRGHGIGSSRPLPVSPRWVSDQDHVAILARNRPEWIEAMLGCFRARAVPFNVNYRYTASELAQVLTMGRPRAVVFEATYASLVEEVTDALAMDVTLVQIADETGISPRGGTHHYESAVATTHRHLPVSTADDRYLLLTGGTTGRPKGVLWRQADVYAAALQGFRKPGTAENTSIDEIIERARRASHTILPAPPLMHGSAQWAALAALLAGHTVILCDTNTRFDADEVIDLVERWNVRQLVIGGDAFARPLTDALRTRRRRMPGLQTITTGAVALTTSAEQQLRALLPHVTIIDAAGASETGPQMQRRSERDGPRPGTFTPGVGTCVLSADRSHPLPVDSAEVGWLARSGRVPLGYLDEPDLTLKTFPVHDGVRYAIPGDRARYVAGGYIELLGRDATVINTGGEKVFAEEVEEALCGHPSVYDAVVVGCPHERWGKEVVAIVALRRGSNASDDELRAFVGERLARYKIPKRVVRVDAVARSAAGKPDYRWALRRARGSAGNDQAEKSEEYV
jgi:acyl-CoA synthetase (AMP-forming)/AMP-acid ligase II